MNKAGLDTNVLIYAFIQSSTYHQEVKGLLSMLLDLHYSLFFTHQNILESERVLEKVYKIPRKQAVQDIEDFIRVFRVRVVSPLPTTLKRYKELLEYSQKSIFDTYLAATLLDYDIHQLFTFNEKDFSGIPNFRASRNP